MKTFRTEFVSVRERRYCVRLWGEAEAGEQDAPTLICLHGWGDVGASFQFVVDALQSNWRVVAPDWRGFGLTQWNEGAYWFPDYLADLDALLELYSPDAPANIVGHSMGGIVASLYAGIRPERVAQLANLEGFGLWVSPQGETPARFAQWLDQVRANDSRFRGYARREEFAARLCKDNPRLTPERAAFLSEHSVLADGEGFVFAGDPRHRWINPVLYPLEEAMSCWRKVEAPVLWLAGRDSVLMRQFADRPEDYAARRDCFAKAQEVIIDDCGHNLHHDQPEEVARQLEAFFVVS